MESKHLYQEVILDHNRKPRNWGKLADASHKAEGLNPLCGDHIWLSLKLDDDGREHRFRRRELCDLQGLVVDDDHERQRARRVAEAEQLIREFRDMATGKLEYRQPAQPPRHDSRVFAGVRDLPSRVKCAILPWHTLHAALHSESTISTEGDRDPVATAG